MYSRNRGIPFDEDISSMSHIRSVSYNLNHLLPQRWHRQRRNVRRSFHERGRGTERGLVRMKMCHCSFGIGGHGRRPMTIPDPRLIGLCVQQNQLIVGRPIFKTSDSFYKITSSCRQYCPHFQKFYHSSDQ
jgi:hypothetical protein